MCLPPHAASRFRVRRASFAAGARFAAETRGRWHRRARAPAATCDWVLADV